MIDQYDLVAHLTSDEVSEDNWTRALSDFAYEFGWRPSDELYTPDLQQFANAHLLVEHGLEISAVITFLRNSWRFADLGTPERRQLFSISYNNLVDWHIYVQSDQVLFVFNRTEQPRIVASAPLSQNNYDQLRSEAFEQITGKRPSTNLPPLDDALIQTISLWRRQLSAELGYNVPHDALSALFNGIIFTRAAEDQARRFTGFGRSYRDGNSSTGLALLNSWRGGSVSTLREALSVTLSSLGGGSVPPYALDERRLSAFDSLDRRTVNALLKDFYRNRYAPYYDYDFSIISKHALSRIYESYVSILRLEDTPQASLFPTLPEPERDRAFGSVYTPQYVARFFARYLRENTTPAMFRQLRSCDPACGSGIFQRTLLEMQTEPILTQFDASLVESIFERVTASDVDENAAQATRLSLALLYLVLTNEFPDDLHVISTEAIEFYAQHPELKETYDAVVANPPFVSLDIQSSEMRTRVSEYMGQDASGRIDMYLPFLKIALELLKPGGYGLFVLPHSFLLADSASGMRRLIADFAWIRLVADLSSVRVFGDVGSYVVLVIFQKKADRVLEGEPATAVRCQDFPGQALEEAVEGKTTQNTFYSIYKVSQDVFGAKDWILLPPAESALRRRLNSLPTLDEFLFAREGVVTGANQVFIVPAAQVPARERAVYVSFLPDRKMGTYTVPEETDQCLFYPFIGGEKISEEQLRVEFPSTWEYLESRRSELENRGSLKGSNLAWWEPIRPRSPQNLMRPKLVSPHLVLFSRFSYDRTGQYAITRSPFLYPKTEGAEDDLLLFFLAVLNSSIFNWHLATHSHTYRGGYLMLEPKTLRDIPVPDPAHQDPRQMRELIVLVEKRLVAHGTRTLEIEEEIDEVVATMYGLTSREREILMFES